MGKRHIPGREISRSPDGYKASDSGENSVGRRFDLSSVREHSSSGEGAWFR